MTARRRLLRDLPIFWKLLLPFVVLLVVVGSTGAFVIVHDLAGQSRAALREQLTLRLVEARSAIHDRELDLSEAATYAGNLDGMSAAVARGDAAAVTALLESVTALKPSVDVVASTRSSGTSVAELVRQGARTEPVARTGTDWSAAEPVRTVTAGNAPTGTGFFDIGGVRVFLVAAPICEGASPCRRVGAAITGEAVHSMLLAVVGAAERPPHGREDIAVYAPDGALVAATGPAKKVLSIAPSTTRIEQRHGHGVVTAYSGFSLSGGRGGTLAVTVPSSVAGRSTRGPALRVAFVVALAMLAAVAAGAVVSGLVVRQLRVLVETSRELGAGRLDARAPVLSADEHGELAITLNRMAEQLEAERSSLELQVEQRTEEIRRLMQRRSEFFAGLSHELRTPLAIIATEASILEAQRDKTTRASAAAIGASAGQLSGMVNDILELARAEAGTIDVHIADVDLADTLRELQPLVTRLGAAAEVTVAVRAPQGAVPVRVDAVRMRDVLVNLVGNAIKYTPGGGSVVVETALDGTSAVLSVADTGIGIDPGVGDRVFDPFYRVPNADPQHGEASSGLGLALARRWVEAMGGSINWQPRAEGGTVFSVTLPLTRGGRRRSPARAGASGPQRN